MFPSARFAERGQKIRGSTPLFHVRHAGAMTNLMRLFKVLLLPTHAKKELQRANMGSVDQNSAGQCNKL
jgi:hypothetical protein